MKKIIATIAITAATIGGISIAHAAPDSKQLGKKCSHKMDLTEDQAKILVNANIIKHHKADTDSIQKVETIKLTKDRTFYIVYAGQEQQESNVFFVVNAQNGHVIPAMGKHHRHGHKHNFQEGQASDAQPQE